MKKLVYKILCLDDKPDTLQYILQMLEDIPFVDVERVVSDPMEALLHMKSNEVDILLLDMDLGMAEMNGVTFANMLNDPPVIIACSSYSQYVFEAADADIVPYIGKTISARAFKKLITEAVEKVDQKEELAMRDVTTLVLLDTASKPVTLQIKDIYYAKIDNTILTVVMDEGEHEFKMSLREFKRRLPMNLFAKPHNSYLVSLAKVSIVSGKKVYLSAPRKTELTISQEFNLEFKHALERYRQNYKQKG